MTTTDCSAESAQKVDIVTVLLHKQRVCGCLKDTERLFTLGNLLDK